MRRKRKISVYALAILGLVFVVLGFVWPGIEFGRDEVCCVHRDIDVNSGEVRERQYIGCVLIRKNISSTPYSKLVGKFVGDSERRQWEWASTETCFGSNISNNVLGDAMGSCNSLARLLDMNDIAEARRAALLKESLELLRNGDDESLEAMVNVLVDEMEDGGT
jgi:hypothetical protein